MEAARREIPDEWDFYPCRVDDAPASLTLNLWFREYAPLPEAPMLYWASIEMSAPDEHGMGTAAEAESLHPISDRIVESAATLGLYQVGRLRNNGYWQLSFYGPRGMASELHAVAKAATGALELEVGSKDDAEWDYYFSFLCPDAERWQWIMDRRVVEQLESHGDDLSKPRRVDHWVHFRTPDERGRFLAAAQARGFAVEAETGPADEGELPYGAQIHRSDSVRLADIHDVVMDLKALAEQSGGDYDGWETSVEKD